MLFGKRYKELQANYADMVQAFHDLEERVIALEKFNEDEGKELLEALQENKKQEHLFTKGMESIIGFSLETTRKKAE